MRLDNSSYSAIFGDEMTDFIQDAAQAFTLRSQPATVQRAIQGRAPTGALTKAEDRILGQFVHDVELGPWAHIVIYNDWVTYKNVTARAAFIKLLRRGRIVITRRVPDADSKYGPNGSSPSEFCYYATACDEDRLIEAIKRHGMTLSPTEMGLTLPDVRSLGRALGLSEKRTGAALTALTMTRRLTNTYVSKDTGERVPETLVTKALEDLALGGDGAAAARIQVTWRAV